MVKRMTFKQKAYAFNKLAATAKRKYPHSVSKQANYTCRIAKKRRLL